MNKAARLQWVAGLLGLALLVSLGVRDSVVGQDPPPKKKDPGTLSASFSSLKIQEEPKFRQVVNLARDCITDKAWEEAVTALQTLLDTKEDHYVQVREKDASGRDVLRWTSVKFEANKLLGTLPGEAMDIYEVREGHKAKAKLDEAKRTGNRELMAEVAQRYYHTRSGAEANDLLGTYFLDRGQYFVAALRFEKLLAMPKERVKISDLTLLKAALAYRRAGDAKNSDAAWKELYLRIGDKGMKLGDEVVTTAELRKAIDAIAVAAAFNAADWPMIRGNLTNTAQAAGSPPLLDILLWKRPLGLDKSDITGEVEEKGKEALDAIKSAMKQIEDAKDRAILPGSFPIAANKLLVYRSLSDVRAVYLQDELDGGGKVVAKAGEIAWKSTDFEGSLANILSRKEMRPTVQNWLSRYNSHIGYGALVFENSLIGTISTDHKYVYAIDDLAVPAPPDQFQPFIWNSNNVANELKPMVLGNVLYAYDLQNGSLIWQLGTKDDGFENTHFLGAPISVGGKLYVLNEKNNGSGGAAGPSGDAELRLVCIDPSKVTGWKPKIVEPIQYLGSVQQTSRFTHYPGRRLSSSHLAYGEGILVCPTHTGELLGVDLASRSLAWAYPYREQSPPPLPFAPMGGPMFPPPPPVKGLPSTTSTGFVNWYASPPAIVDGKVVFTAPDANSVHCVNLRDGTPVWKKRQAEGDLYMAGVFYGKVLIVNKSRVTALSLADGRALWSVPTGDMPSGQGVASSNIYYLPLAKGEILAIDVERGVIKAHNRARTGGVTPGNLVFYEGAVVSQTPLEIMAYPQLVARLDQANIELAKNPRDPEKLVNRGELFLADGQVQRAVADLELAMELKPADPLAKRGKTRLYEALTDLLQIDFKGASGRYLKQYEELCKLGDTPQETMLREAKFFRIVGQGREGEGSLVDAYDNYKKFGALGIHKTLGTVAALDDPSHKVPVEIWLRGRISAMMAKATPEQKEPLERKIAEEWKVVEARKDMTEIRFFVNMFDIPFAVGRQARIHLADTIMDRGEKGSFLEAELHLQRLRTSAYRSDPDGGKALAALALLEEKKGSPESLKLAAAYYRELSRDFGDVPVRGTKTGNALFNNMAADKRFLPYLGGGHLAWGSAKVAARELPAGALHAGLQGFIFMPDGDLTPRMKHHRLVMDPANVNDIALRLVDITTNEVRWTKRITGLGSLPNQQYVQFLYQQGTNNTMFYPNAKFRYFQCKGHLIVFQIGTHAICLHADTGDVLWQHTLCETTVPAGAPGLVLHQVLPDDDGYLDIVIWNQFNNQKTRVPVGHVGSVQASYVALVTQKGLQVVDPLKGSLLWKKMDVTPSSRVFGDENYLFLVENADAEAAGIGRVLNAGDGTSVDSAPDFGLVYQNRLHIDGRQIVAAFPNINGVTLKRYDLLTGKDVWNKAFIDRATALVTEDPALTGIVDSAGNVVVLNAVTGAELMKSNVVKSQVLVEDLKGLQQPVLLADADRYYIALNRGVDASKVSGGVIGNNFGNGLRCMQVNGWLVALKRGDGEEKVGDKTRTRKNGDFLWHTFKPLGHQMVVLEQFEDLPVLIFTSRFNEMINGGLGGNRWISLTQSVDKRTGKMIWDARRDSNSSAQFYGFTLDPHRGVVTMMGLTSTLQHYIDDGRKLPGPTAGEPGVPGATGGGAGASLTPPGFPVPPPPPPMPVLRRGGAIILRDVIPLPEK